MSKQSEHKLPMTFERYVEPVHDSRTGELKSLRISVDLVPGRIRGIKADRKVVVTIAEWRRPK